MIVKARSTAGPRETFAHTTVERRDPGPHDVLIDISYAGICHSDVAHARSSWGAEQYPMVPGHEIAGSIAAVGSAVSRFAVGDLAGVGVMVDSCRECAQCRAGRENQCSAGYVKAYGSVGRDGRLTQGGYSEQIVVDEAYVLRLPGTIPLPDVAPLLCAGITMYSPLRHWRAGPGTRVAVVGLGGLGHVGTRLSAALGAHTTVIDLAPDKHEDALRLGAEDFRSALDDTTFKDLADTFDLIVSTIPTSVDLNPYLRLLAMDGTLVSIGMSSRPLVIEPNALMDNRRSVAGSRFGGIAETQEMLDFCGARGIGAEVEVISADRIDEAFVRLLAGDVRYRFVIDNSTL